MAMQDDIRFLAKEHGAAELTDEEVRAIEKKVACSLIDQCLDKPAAARPPTQTSESCHDNGKA